MRIFDTNFSANKTKYIIQSALAGVAVASALLFFDVARQPVLIASFGSSAFVAFTMPHKEMSRPRFLIGGYIVGMIVGCSLHYAAHLSIDNEIGQKLLYVILGGAAVALAMFIMGITNTEHSPGASIALGLTINDWSLSTLILVICGICLIAGVHRLMRNWMIDLF